MQTILNEMAHMEFRLTKALACSGGEQAPASSFTSLFDSFNGTATSSATAP